MVGRLFTFGVRVIKEVWRLHYNVLYKYCQEFYFKCIYRSKLGTLRCVVHWIHEVHKYCNMPSKTQNRALATTRWHHAPFVRQHRLVWVSDRHLVVDIELGTLRCCVVHWIHEVRNYCNMPSKTQNREAKLCIISSSSSFFFFLFILVIPPFLHLLSFFLFPFLLCT